MMKPLPNSGPKGPPAQFRRTQEGVLLKHCNNVPVDGVFREAVESQKKDNTPLLQLVHSDDLKYADSFRRFFNVFVQRFVVCFSFIDCEGSIPCVIFDPSIAKGD
jgi:hypothetical protein